jgi:hypothetical protein
MVDARLDFLYRDAGAMEKLDKVDDSLQGPAGSTLRARCSPGTPSIHPRTTGPPPSAPPPRTPDRPTTVADHPTTLSNDEGQADK